MKEDYRVDETFGDVYDHVARDAGGFPDSALLRRQNRLAHSERAPAADVLAAQKFMGKVALDYKLVRYATIINRSLYGTHDS